MQSYSAVEFDALAEKYASLNWRLVSKPGGATVKPDDFYVLYGCASQSDHLKPTFCCHMECCTLVGWAVTSGGRHPMRGQGSVHETRRVIITHRTSKAACVPQRKQF